jgi:Family of unknown function (DUF5681)
MTKRKPKDQTARQDPGEVETASKESSKADYVVGKYRPPAEYRWQPGQSGNPSGRPKGRANVKTELERIFAKKIKVRDGDTDRQFSLLGANVLAHGVKGANGDVRSASLFLNSAQKMGLFGPEDSAVPGLNQRADSIILPVSNKSRPSDKLLDGVDLDLLTREEKIELSRLADIIDLGGDFTALSIADFERIKSIVNKGRGKDVTPQ